jgi:hypothetical protein
MSGGSLAPPHIKEVVPPGEHLTAQCVSGSILMSTVMSDPGKARDKHDQFLKDGVQIIHGQLAPPPPASLPPAAAEGQAPSKVPSKKTSEIFGLS